MNDSQIGAIKFARATARQIATDIPEIAGDYLEGKTYLEIIREYDIMEKYGIGNTNTAKTVLHYAMKSFFPEDFLEELAFMHISDNGSLLSEEGQGFFSRKSRVEAGRKGTEAKGYEIWEPRDVRLVLRKSKSKKYLTPAGRVRTRIIAEELGVDSQRVINLLNRIKRRENGR